MGEGDERWSLRPCIDWLESTRRGPAGAIRQAFFRDRALQTSPGFFPVPAVKFSDPRLQPVFGIETMEIDAPAIGMRSWLVKAFYATVPAKQMFRLPAAKSVTGQITLAFDQGKLPMRRDQMQKTGARANRAVAVEQFGRCFYFGFETDSAAMAATLYRGDHHAAPSNLQI